MKSKRQNELSLGDALKLMVKDLGMEEKLLATETEMLWEEVMGTFIANYTINLKVERRVLFVKLKSAELRNELQYSKTKIINHINEKLGKEFLLDVKFV